MTELKRIRGVFAGFWHGEHEIHLLFRPDPADYDPETSTQELPHGAPCVLEFAPKRQSDAPDVSCYTLPDGSCIGKNCMHDLAPASDE